MSIQTVFGTGVMAILFAGVFRVLGFATDDPTYIEVHSLDYSVDGGIPYITQSRTVSVDGPLLIAKWEAWVYLIEGTELVEICSGGDGADYTKGFLDHKMTFDYWVGESGCFDKIPDKSLVKIKARHTWGEGYHREKTSERFLVDKSVF